MNHPRPTLPIRLQTRVALPAFLLPTLLLPTLLLGPLLLLSPGPAAADSVHGSPDNWPDNPTAAPAATAQLAPLGADKAYAIGPASAWVEPISINALRPSHRDHRDDVSYLLRAQQTRVDDTSVERFYHNARQVRSATGVARASEVVIHFTPAYEKLTLHFVKLIRAGESIGVLDKAQVKVVQPESDWGNRIYQERLQVLIFVPDVRAGDVLEYAYTTRGNNPALAGRYAAHYSISDTVATSRVIYRLLWPETRTLHLRPHNTELTPTQARRNGFIDYRWDVRDVAPVPWQDDVPSWHTQFSWIQLSEYPSWGAVASWANELFEPSVRHSPEMHDLTASWMHLAPEGRLLSALKFVQDEVRYLGIEVGPHSLVPHNTASVMARRFGDCKDKSLLLVTLLRSLQIEAYPALVHTRRGTVLGDLLPTAYAFNHAIVQAKLGERTLWLDATKSLERGALAARNAPVSGQALVLAADTTQLTPIIATPITEPERVVTEHFSVPVDGEVTLRITLEYRGSEAHTLRHRLASSKQDVEDQIFNQYSRMYKNVHRDGPLKVDSQEAANTFELTVQYRLTDFWNQGEVDFSPWSIQTFLQSPSVTERTAPLAIEFPVFHRHITEVAVSSMGRYAERTFDKQSPALHLTQQLQHEGDLVTLTYTVQTQRDHVTTAEVPQHLEMLNLARERSVTILSSNSQPVTHSTGIWIAAALLLILSYLSSDFWLPVLRRLRDTRNSRAHSKVERDDNRPDNNTATASNKGAVLLDLNREMERLRNRHKK